MNAPKHQLIETPPPTSTSRPANSRNRPDRASTGRPANRQSSTAPANPRRGLTPALLAVLAVLALACSQPEGNGIADEATGPAVESRPGPVASASRAALTPDEIRERTVEYAALQAWARAARRSAENDPGDFHQALLSEPSPECVEKLRELAREAPGQWEEMLNDCMKTSAARSREREWNNVSQDERETAARRAAGLLYWSIDPPSLMSVVIARQRGLDVSVRTNPVFARFAAEYRACEDAVEGYAAELAGAGTQEELAERWLRTERELQTCSGEATAGLFDRR